MVSDGSSWMIFDSLGSLSSLSTPDTHSYCYTPLCHSLLEFHSISPQVYIHRTSEERYPQGIRKIPR